MRSLTPIFSILIAILLYFFLIDPMYADIKDIRSETATFRKATTDYDNFSQQLNLLLDVKSGQNPLTIERLNQFVPENIDSAHIIADLEFMAKDNNMLFGNISTESSDINFKSRSSNSQGTNSKTPVSAELQTADVSFELIGTYDQLQNFLVELESSLTLMEVIGLDFTASDGLFEQFSLTIRSYALPSVNN